MKSFAVMSDGSLCFTDVPIPEINDYQALVKIEACGVCNGTDIKIVHKTFKNFNNYPALLGHEAVGKVVKTGKKVRHLKIGDRVLLPFLDDNHGGFASGWGGYSEYGIVGDSRSAVEDGVRCEEHWHAQQVVPEHISAEEAVMIVTFREVLSAIDHFGIKPNDSVIVFGAGPVGLCFTKFLKLLGIKTVITTDITDEKTERAKLFGADYALNTANTNIDEFTTNICPEKVDCVIDAVGVTSLVNTAMKFIKDHGKICCYGISPNTSMNIDWTSAPYNWSLNFVQFPSKYEESLAYTQILNWISLGILNPSDFISHVIPFKNIHEAFAMIEEKRTDLKTVITMED